MATFRAGCQTGGSIGLAHAAAGSGALTRWSLENDVVDEIDLLIVPVVVGQGMRLFAASGRM